MCYVLRPLTEKYKAKFDGEPVVSREFMDGDKVLIEDNQNNFIRRWMKVMLPRRKEWTQEMSSE